MFEVIILSVWLTTSIILFVCAKNVIDGKASNISYNSKAVWITSAVIGLFWPLILIISTRMVSLGSVSAAVLFPVLTMFITENYIVPILKARKIIKEIDKKISSVFDLQDLLQMLKEYIIFYKQFNFSSNVSNTQ